MSSTLKKIEGQTKKTMENISKSVQNTRPAFDWLKGTIAAAAAGFSIKGAWDWLVKSNAEMEKYQQTLTVVMKSQKEAVETLAWAQKFAAKTPFEIPEIVEATTRLYSYGITAKNVLGDIGDMAAAMGKPLMQAVEAIADAQTGELERLKEFGITKQMLIDQALKLGKGEIVNAKGQITNLKDLNETLISIIRERYHGAMEAQSKTLDGMISNLKDWLGTTGRTLGEGVFKSVKPALASLLDYLNKLTDSGAVERWAESIGDAFKSVGKSVQDTFGFLSSAYDMIKNQNWEELGKATAEGILKALKAVGNIGTKVLDWIVNQITSINWRDAGSKSAKPALEFVVGFVDTLFDPSFWIKNWQTVLTGALIFLPVGKLLKIPGVKQIADYILPIIGKAAKTVASSVVNFFKDTGSSLVSGIMKGIGKDGPKLALSLKNVFKDAVKSIKSVGETLYLSWLEVWARAGKAVGVKAAVIRAAVINAVNSAINAGKQVVGKSFEIGMSIVRGIWNGIKSLGSWIRNSVIKWVEDYIPKPIKNILKIKSPSQVMMEIGKQAGLGLVKGLEITKDQLQSTAESLSSSLISALSTIAGAVGTGSLVNKIEVRGTIQDLIVESLKLVQGGVKGSKNIATSLTSLLGLVPKAVEDPTGLVGKNLLSSLKKIAVEAAKISGQAGYTIENAINSALAQIDENVREKYRSWIEQINDIGTEFGSAIGKNSEESLIKLNDLIEDLLTSAQAFAEQGDKAGQYLVAALTEVSRLIPSALNDATGELGQQVISKLKEAALEVNKITGDSSFQIRRAFRDAARSAAQSIDELRQKMSSFMSEVDQLYQDMQNSLSEAKQQYLEDVESTNKELQKNIEELQKNFENTLENTAESLRNWTGLFDDVPELARDSIRRMLKSLRDQVSRFDVFYDMLKTLTQRGVDEGLIEELRKMGPKAAPQVLALVQATDAQLQEYVALWQERAELAKEEAANQLQGTRQEMIDQIEQMRSDANAKLSKLYDTWQSQIKKIKDDTEKKLQEMCMSSDMYGSIFMINLMESIKKQYPEFVKVINQVIEKMMPEYQAGYGYSGGSSGSGGSGSGGSGGGSSSEGGSSQYPRYIFAPDYYKMINGVAAIKASELSTYGFDVKWNESTRMVEINGVPVAPLKIENGRAWVGIRQVFEGIAGRSVYYDSSSKMVYVYHEGGQVTKQGPRSLKNDEVPIIAREGEWILPASQSSIVFDFEAVLKRQTDRIIEAIEKRMNFTIQKVVGAENANYYQQDVNLEKVSRQIARDILLLANG